MHISNAEWIPYALPFRHPWRTSKGTERVRSGRLLRLHCPDGLTGWGDAAPWPAFGINDTRATTFAEECAHFDLAAQRDGKTLCHWLGGSVQTNDVAVNANLGPLIDCTPAQLQQAFDNGFTVIKLKLGISLLEDELDHLQRLASAAPAAVRFRLDANGAWAMPEAERMISACNELPVESFEEPCRDPTLAMLSHLQERCSFPIAIDESIELLAATPTALPPVRRLVLKPGREGLLGTCERAFEARQRGMEIVITSAIESACGLTACLQLAAFLSPDGVHGLATAECLAKDTGTSPAVKRGRMQLPTAAGVGFSYTPTGG